MNTKDPIKSIDILGDFQVTTEGTSVSYEYQLFQTSTTSNLLSILQTQQCGCDTTNTGSECSAPFSASPSDLLYCVDVTDEDPSDANKYFYTVYEKIAIGVPETVLVTSGNRV